MLFERFKMSLYGMMYIIIYIIYTIINKYHVLNIIFYFPLVTEEEIRKLSHLSDDSKENDNPTSKPIKKKIEIREKLTAANGKTMSSEKIFIAAFQHVQKESAKFLRKKKVRAKKHEIQWIITVPAIWSEAAKYKMKEWATKAGLIDDAVRDQCKIVYEPDCASLAIQHEVKNSNFTTNACNPCDDMDDSEDEKLMDDNQEYEPIPDFFYKGEKYILVDAGGGILYFHAVFFLHFIGFCVFIFKGLWILHVMRFWENLG